MSALFEKVAMAMKDAIQKDVDRQLYGLWSERAVTFTHTPMTDKKQQYLDAAKALDALGDTSLAEACRAKAASIIPPKPENPWVGGRNTNRYRLSLSGDKVECASDYWGDCTQESNLIPDTVRGLAKQLGMIDPKNLKWGGMGFDRSGNERWEYNRNDRNEILRDAHGMYTCRIFQHLPVEVIK